MVNLDSIKNLDSISVSEVNLHSVIQDSDTSLIGTDTYKNIINEAKKLNTKPLTNSVLSVKNGNMVFSETSDWNDSIIQKYGDFSSTSSTLMTEINPKQKGGIINSDTSNNYMTEIRNNNTDLSSTSSAFMSELDTDINNQSGGVRKSKTVKRYPIKAKQGKALSPVDESDSTSSSSLSDSDSDSDLDSSSSDEQQSAGKYMNGTRYLMSETTSIYGVSESSVSSSLSTEDLRFFRK